jgi:periplasmic copper chaperone A
MFRHVLGAAFAAALLIVPAFAHDTFRVGSLEISGGFTRATLPNAPVGGGYITIVNHGSADDTLIAATSPAAEEVQLHEMKMEGAVMKMTELPDGIPVPAGATVTLAPGGLHLMMMGLTAPLIEGETVPVTLTFANAGTVEIMLVVGSINAKEPEHPGEHK